MTLAVKSLEPYFLDLVKNPDKIMLEERILAGFFESNGATEVEAREQAEMLAKEFLIYRNTIDANGGYEERVKKRAQGLVEMFSLASTTIRVCMRLDDDIFFYKTSWGTPYELLCDNARGLCNITYLYPGQDEIPRVVTEFRKEGLNGRFIQVPSGIDSEHFVVIDKAHCLTEGSHNDMFPCLMPGWINKLDFFGALFVSHEFKKLLKKVRKMHGKELAEIPTAVERIRYSYSRGFLD